MNNMHLQFYLVSFSPSLSEGRLLDIANQIPDFDESPVIKLSVINTQGNNRVLSVGAINAETLRDHLDSITSQHYNVCYDNGGEIACSSNIAPKVEEILTCNPLVF